MEIEESKHNIKQEGSLLYPMVYLFEKLWKEWSLRKLPTLQPQGEKWSIFPTYWYSELEKWKSLWEVGRHSGSPKDLSGLQGPFFVRLQELPDSKERNSYVPWVWGFSKPHKWNRLPGDDCGCIASTQKWNNGIQGGNGEPHTHQPHIISEFKSSARNLFGAFQAAEVTKGQYKCQENSNWDTGNW